MRQFLRDIYHGARRWRTEPLRFACVVLIIAAGIGVNVAVYTVARSIMFRPLGLQSSDELFHIYLQEPRNQQLLGLSESLVAALSASAEQGIAVISSLDMTSGVASGQWTGMVHCAVVSEAYFDVLGLEANRGRVFHQADVDTMSSQPVVISESLSRRAYGSAEGAIGGRIQVRGLDFTVIGIARPDFRGLLSRSIDPTDVWIPMTMGRQRGLFAGQHESAATGPFQGTVRIPPGVAPGVVAEHVSRVAQSVAASGAPATRATGPPLRAVLVDANSVFIHPRVDLRWTQVARAGFALSALILAVALANLANTFIAQGSSRSRELAIRLALGATRRRLAIQLIGEAVVVIFTGSTVGAAAAVWSAAALSAHSKSIVPGLTGTDGIAVSTDLVTVLWCMVMGGTVCLGAAVVPAARARIDVYRELAGSRSRSIAPFARQLVAHMLVVPQIAASVFLCVAAYSMVGAERQRAATLGYETESTAFVTIDLSVQGYDTVRGRELFREAVERIRLLPGVRSVSKADWPAVGGGTRIGGLRPLAGTHRGVSLARVHLVDPSFFSTVQMRLVRGRYFEGDSSLHGADETVVDEKTASRYWPGQSAIGQEVQLQFGSTVGQARGWRSLRVVGIVSNVIDLPADEDNRDRLYVLTGEEYLPKANIIVASTEPSERTLARLSGVVRELDSSVALMRRMSLAEYSAAVGFAGRAGAVVLLVLSALGIVIASVGIVAVMERTTAARTHEMAVRRALGASSTRLVCLASKNGLLALSGGLALGIAVALGWEKSVRAVNVGQTGILSRPFLLGVGTVVIISAACALVPAIRAVRASMCRVLRWQ